MAEFRGRAKGWTAGGKERPKRDILLDKTPKSKSMKIYFHSLNLENVK